jgi:hypothetical protein
LVLSGQTERYVLPDGWAKIVAEPGYMQSSDYHPYHYLFLFPWAKYHIDSIASSHYNEKKICYLTIICHTLTNHYLRYTKQHKIITGREKYVLTVNAYFLKKVTEEGWYSSSSGRLPTKCKALSFKPQYCQKKKSH